MSAECDTTQTITYRAFAADDFPQAAELVRLAWCTELGEPAGNLAAQLELATYLGRATWGLVAEREGELLGVVLGAVHGDEIPQLEHWRAEVARLEAEVSKDGETAALVQTEMAGVAEEDRLEAEYRASGAEENDAALKLLVVSPGARGLGVGGRLFAAGVEHARTSGARGYHLLTDDACDVSFYEHKGLTQAMRKVSEAEWPGGTGADGKDFHIYVYSQRF